VVLHELATGRLPFTRAEALSRAAGTAPPLRAPAVSAPFSRLLEELLAPSPADRPEGAVAVLGRLVDEDQPPPERIDRCPGCGARLPPELRLCLSCGQSIARFAHTRSATWSLVLENLSDDTEALGRLLDLLGALALPTRMRINFLTGQKSEYSPEERRAAIALPAVLFSELDEPTARGLEAIFRREQLDVRLVDAAGTRSLKAMPTWMLGGSAGTVAASAVMTGILWGPLAALIGAGAAVATMVVVQLARDHLRVSQSNGLFRLRGDPAPVPAAEGLLALLAGELAEVHGREARQWLGDVGATLFRLVRTSKDALAGRVTAAVPSLTASLSTLVRRVDAIDGELARGSEAELLQQLARLERRLAAEPERLEGSRRELDTALDRRHRLEQERDRLTTTLALLLGHLRETCARIERVASPEEAERQLEAASALVAAR
jgi:hypothetical protein